jgi:exonuclease SbcD
MKLLHTSDWHLGRNLFSVPLLDHQKVFLEWLVDQVDEHQVDAVIISGDIYDRSVPAVETISLFEWALIELAKRTEVVLIPGNHDSATRLGFAGPLLEAARVHVRASAADLTRPIILTSKVGDAAQAVEQIQIFCIPYLEPAFHSANFGCERSHAAVLGAAMDQVRSAADFEMPIVVVSHAFITGGVASESERDVRVGGIPDAPVSIFQGANYVALGHLHRPQELSTPDGMLARYSGSPIAYSFSEEGQVKSVVLLEITNHNTEAILLSTPTPRPLSTIRGDIDDLLSNPVWQEVQDHWIRAVVTDDRRPERPMERLRERFPHTLQLEFAPSNATLTDEYRAVDIANLDPVEVTAQFINYVAGVAATDEELTLIEQAVERVRIAQAQ